MSTKHLLRSFAGGEITPELAGRLDLVKYQTGLALCRNFVTLPHGPAARRPGTEFIAQVKDSTRKTRVIPFTFSADQTAVLELGHEYIRVHINGGALLEVNQTITEVAGAVVTVTTHGYVAGDWIYIGGAFYIVASATTDTFTVTDLAGNTGAPAGTIAARVVTIETPYQEADLFDIHYAQSADVVTLTHPGYATRELSRLSAVSWALSEVSFTPPAAVPTSVTATPTVAVSTNLTQAKYVVTAVADDGVTETLPSATATATNNLTLAGNFNTITWDAVNGYSRYNVYKLRGGVYGYVGQVTPTAGASAAIATATPYQDIGFFKYGRVRVTTTTSHGLASGDSVFIDGTGYFDGVFTVIRESSTVFTYAKVTVFSFEVTTGNTYIPTLSLVDDNVQADTTQSPPENIVSLNKGIGDYPSTTVYHEQRRWFAGTQAQPQALWATRTGTDDNLTSSIPSRDADGMQLRVASSQYNQIRHLVALSDLIALTAGGEFRIFADGAPAITPTSVSVKPQGYSGASNVQPVVTAGTVMYVQAQGSRIRELSYSWEASSYRTADASIMAPHRFNYHTITDLAFSRTPDPILWAVRDDGLLLGMTYVPDQQVYGWHAHDTDGTFESVTVVPEGNEDVLYVIIKREIGTRSVRYLERLGTRYFSQLAYANFVDCGASFTTEQDLTDVTFTEIGSTDMVSFDAATLEGSLFHVAEVGANVWAFDLVDGPLIRLTILDKVGQVLQTVVMSEANPNLLFGNSVSESETDFYISASGRRPFRIAKDDPTNRGMKTAMPLSMASQPWFPTPGGNNVWVYCTDDKFRQWSFTTNAVTDTWEVPTPKPTRGDDIDSIYHALVLPSGTIVYTVNNAGVDTRVYFLGGSGAADYIEIPTRSGDNSGGGEQVWCMKYVAEEDAIWLLTSASIVKVDTNTNTISANYAYANAAPDTALAYDSARQYLFWVTAGDAGTNPDLVTFNTATGTIASVDPFPTDRTATDAVVYLGEPLAHIDGVLWSGAGLYPESVFAGGMLLAMYV
jgi:hypothetical protein